MNAILTQTPPGSDSTTAAGSSHLEPATGMPLRLLKLEGAATFGGAALGYAALGGPWTLFVLLFLVPDLSMLGYVAGARVGATLGVHGLLCAACVWAAHIGADRLLGFGMKTDANFGDTHLGQKGR